MCPLMMLSYPNFRASDRGRDVSDWPTQTEGSASIIAGSLGISGPVVVVPVQGDNSISVQRWIVVPHIIISKDPFGALCRAGELLASLTGKRTHQEPVP